MRRGKLSTNGIFHVYNRGADKREIFCDSRDYLRFVHGLYEFNDENPAENITYGFIKNPVKISLVDGRGVPSIVPKHPREMLVDVLAFALMPNHFHLLLKQRKENGVTKFMQKLGAGYALYFNEKNQRSGVLFQGRFKAVEVRSDEYLLHLPYYIHANPLDLNVNGINEIEFLNSYRWSSHMDYCGWRNFPSVTQRDFLLKFFDGEKNYKKSITKWVKEKSRNVEKMRTVAIEEFVILISLVAFGYQLPGADYLESLL